MFNVPCYQLGLTRATCSQCNPIPGFEEANMFLENGNVIHFKAPKIQANLQSKVIAISGTGQEKSMSVCRSQV